MKKGCYVCGNKEIAKGTMSPYIESDVGSYIVPFAEMTAEVEVCKNCGAVITMKKEHKEYNQRGEK
ncbi:hypothetical protein [Bacillus rhizoplanae]|uniref:hypothetical protein n=1 Tax=Bacillus rhizoplanae TaxID=2880966 RepID=UPI003D2431BF